MNLNNTFYLLLLLLMPILNLYVVITPYELKHVIIIINKKKKVKS